MCNGKPLFCRVLLGVHLIFGWGCNTPQKSTETDGARLGPRPDEQAPARPLQSAQGLPEAVTAAPVTPTSVPFVDAPNEEGGGYAELSDAWGQLQIVDLGPAASVTATPRGAVFVTRDDRLVVAAKRGAELEPITLPPEAFSKYGWGPAVSATHAYWSSQRGQLMRGALATLTVEPVFARARPGTRTVVQTASERDVVAFVATIDERSFAYVWVSPGSNGAEVLDASADGHEATSVSLLSGKPHPRLVVLEGRTSMSPVHARTVRVTPRRAILDTNHVVWVGPGSHELTEIHATTSQAGDMFALLATQRDFDGFGLAQLRIPPEGETTKEPSWRLYPNGLDPAPLTAAHFCGKDYVLFVRPSERRPRSPQELHIAPLSKTAPEEGEVLVRSRAFNDISVAEVPEGALLVWTADRRSWGTVLRCPR